VLHRRVQEAGEDELRAWRAGCLETCLSGSEGGGWKRARKSNALAAYLIDEGEQVRVFSPAREQVVECVNPTRCSKG
jgi:hypothetical protein